MAADSSGAAFTVVSGVPKDDVLDLTLQVIFADGTTKKLKLNKSDGTPVTFRKFRKHVISAKIDPVTFELVLNLSQKEWDSYEESLEYTDHVSVLSGGRSPGSQAPTT